MWSNIFQYKKPSAGLLYSRAFSSEIK